MPFGCFLEVKASFKVLFRCSLKVKERIWSAQAILQFSYIMCLCVTLIFLGDEKVFSLVQVYFFSFTVSSEHFVSVWCFLLQAKEELSAVRVFILQFTCIMCPFDTFVQEVFSTYKFRLFQFSYVFVWFLFFFFF